MYKEIYETWKSSSKLTAKEKEELCALTDEKEIEFRFGKDLEFGTAGMRGIIGLGTNMLNVHTVKRATQGLSEFISAQGEKAKKRGVAISYDTRKMSFEFAYAAAVVLASNGIRVFMFNDVHPVPMLSFAVRKLKAVVGIMITASHNPKEYNGYKVYGEDGAQMSPQATAEVVKYINAIDILSDAVKYDEKTSAGYIRKMPSSVDRRYYKVIKSLALSPKQTKAFGKRLKIVYTPLHGSGYIPVTTILNKIGINALLVPEQVNKDPEFSTVSVPNPEDKNALMLGIKLADFKNADVVFGTDPDCDRLGVAIRNAEGEFEALTGNQTGILLLDYILTRLKETGKLDKKGFVVKSFVTTGMAKAICDGYGAELFEVPVGFKFIGEKIKQLDDTGMRKFIFGFEESCGYLRGTHCRDKDAVVASMLFAEMTCYYAANGVSLHEVLSALYKKYGYVFDCNVSVTYGGLDAMKNMGEAVDKARNCRVTEIGGLDVVAVRDYAAGIRKLTGGGEEPLNTPSVNAVYFELSGGSFVCVRPSGTEPKLKIYYSVKAEDKEAALNLYEKIKADFDKIMN